MDLQEFIEAHPGITRKQLSRIVGCTTETVNRWFLKPGKAIPPTELHLQRLAIAHWLWTQEAAEPEFFKELRQIKVELDRASV